MGIIFLTLFRDLVGTSGRGAKFIVLVVVPTVVGGAILLCLSVWLLWRYKLKLKGEFRIFGLIKAMFEKCDRSYL